MNFSSNSINELALITADRLDVFLKINRRTSPFIREVRVHDFAWFVHAYEENFLQSFISRSESNKMRAEN